MRISLSRRQTQSTLESIIDKAQHYTQPSVQDLDHLRPHQIPSKQSDKVLLYDAVYKRLDNAFTKQQLRHLTRELHLRQPSKPTKHNLVDLLLSRWGVHSEHYLTKQNQAESLRRREASEVVVLPDHALFLLLGRDGQGHHQLVSSPFGVKVTIRRSPKLALSLVGTNDGVARAKDFLDAFVRDTHTTSIHVEAAQSRLSKSVALGISRISNAYLDPHSLESDTVTMYAQDAHNLNIAKRLLHCHLRYSRNEQPKIVVATHQQSLPLTLLPFEFRDERPWDLDLTRSAHHLGVQTEPAMMQDEELWDTLPADEMFSHCDTLSQLAQLDANQHIEIELGHYLYLQNSYSGHTDVDASTLSTPQFVPCANPASLKIPLASASQSPQLRLTYRATSKSGDVGIESDRIFNTVLKQGGDGQPVFEQSVADVAIEGVVMPGLPTDARFTKHTSTTSLHGLDAALGQWIEQVNGEDSGDRMPPLSLIDGDGVSWELQHHHLVTSSHQTLSPGVTLVRESIVNNETAQTHECARIVLRNETQDVDRTSIHTLLTRKWGYVYDHIKWSRPPREYQEYQEREQEESAV